MAKWLLVVESECADPAKDREFNEWYDKTHLPDVLQLPGFLRATRYQTADPKQGGSTYLAVYEVETDDIQAVMKEADEGLKRAAAQGRMSPLLKMNPPRLYRQIAARAR
jgi:hypothetical protein